MKVKRFEELVVWRKAKDLSVEVYRLTAGGQFGRDRGLRDQIRRAAVSVMSNVAEGFERYSRAEFKHFLSIARGSASEVRSQLHLAHELGYLPAHEHRELHDQCVEVSRLLAALRASTDAQ
ncbi:MAG TPA: four helix bundle protein [Longimicrobium sp.]|jgi:four helix bundle protein